MVDVVTNHMAYVGCGACVDYSTLNPFNSVCYAAFVASMELIFRRNHTIIRFV
jgi:hypothetical protein